MTDEQWEEVTTYITDIKKIIGKVYRGTYSGKSEIATKLGKQTVYHFDDKDGNPFSIYGFTNLNRIMESVKPDSELRITYLGTERMETKYGIKDVHQVRVEKNLKKDDVPF